jgi:hypothetical protein
MRSAFLSLHSLPNVFAAFGKTILAAMLLLALPVAIQAQEITGSVRGTVTDPSGNAAAGATVIVTDTRTSSNRTVTTSDSGNFNVRNLTVGGPYSIRISSAGFQSTTIIDVFTTLSGATNFNVALLSQSSAIEEVVVVASAIRTADLAIGPSSSFDLGTIRALPSISRQVRDIIRLDPRVGVGRAAGGNGFGVSCLGGSNRSNSFTIDGVASADGFGLNASGNSARNTFPIPFDSMANASVEFAPIDVQYGRFTGCNVNVVTKSGTNEWQGSTFYLFNDEDSTGDTINGNTVLSEPFQDTNWGAEVGGPLIRDKLFFYGSYEETDEGGAQNTGPFGGGFANEQFLSLSDANQISDILKSQYGRDPGNLVRNLPQFSERYFARLDWNINDLHRAELTYTNLQEANTEPDDFGFDGFSFSDNFEAEGTEQESLSFRLFSDWTDSFSTEFRYSQLEVVDIQGPLGGGEAQDDNKPRIIVQDGTGSDIFVSGPGFFRSANDLQYDLDQLKLAGHYTVGDHRFTAGYELDSLSVFNLFVANGTGTITFADVNALAAGTASSINGDGSFTGNINDAAAAFERNIHSFYVQDTWQPTDSLQVVAGVRYDTYQSDDKPINNPIYEQRYGFRNDTSFDGLDLLMPRVGLTYDLPFDALGSMQLTGGFGLFSGGDPTVHFANAFQNFGGAIGFGSERDCAASDLNVLAGGSFNGLPACIGNAQRAQAALNTGRADAVDPSFELPHQQRWNVGLNWFVESDIDFLDGWQVQADYIYSDAKEAAEFLDLTLTQNVDAAGNLLFLPDGRPQFNAIDPLRAGCSAQFVAPGQGFANVSSACDSGGDDQDILLTNGVSGETHSFSLQANRSFDFSVNTALDVRFGYAYTDATIGNPINSSTATSGFEEVATAVINNNRLAPAQYAEEHNFVLSLNFEHYWTDGAPLQAGVFIRRRSGRPFSYAYDNNTPTTVFGDSDNEERNLFYVPTGPTDPLVDISSLVAAGTDADFFAFLNESGLNQYAGGIAGRNSFQQDWATDVDLRLQQDITLPGNFDHKLKLFFDIENLLNLFGDSNNINRFADNGDVNEAVPVLDAALSADRSQFIYSNFNPGNGNNIGIPTTIDVDDTVWRIQAGIRYEFGGF